MTQARGGFYQQKIIPAPFPLKKSVLLIGCALAALHVPAHAQEIDGTLPGIGNATTITDNTAVTDTTDNIAPYNGREYGLIDADGGSFNVLSITAGVDNGSVDNTNINIFDSVGGGDTVTIDGDVTVTSSNDRIAFLVGSSNYYGSNNNSSTGIDFNGNIDAGDGGVTIYTTDSTYTDTLTFSGTSYDLGGGMIALNATHDSVTFDGSSAQTFIGQIYGGVYDKGDLVVNNAAGVTFSNGSNEVLYRLNSVTIAGNGTDSAATFKSNVYFNNGVGGITLGDGSGSDTNTLTFDTSDRDIALAGTIDGTAGDTDNLVITGGNTFSQTLDADYNLDNLQVTGSGTVAEFNPTTSHLLSGTATIDSGATLRMKANTLDATGGIINNGTLHIDGGSGFLGDITGTGVIDVDSDAYLDGVTASAVDVATGVQLVVASGNRTYNVNTTTLNGTAYISFSQFTVIGNIVANSSGNGTVSIQDNTGTTILDGDIGTSASNTVGNLTFGSGSNATTLQTKGNLFVDTITLRASDTLQFTGTSAQSVSGDITGSGAVKVGNGSTASNVTFSGAVTGYAGDFNVMNNAAANLANTFSNTGNFSVDGTLNTNSTFTNTGNFNVGGILNTNNTFTNTGSFSVDGTLNANSAFTNNGSFSVGGTLNANSTFTNTGNFSVGGTLNVNNTFTNNGNLSIDGDMTVSQGVNATVGGVVAGSAQGNLYLTVGTDSNGNDTSATLFDTGGALDFANLDGTNANTATLALKPGTGVVTVGQEFLIIDGATTVANFTNGTTIADDFALFDFTLYDGATAILGTDDSDIVATVGLVDLAAVTNSVTNADTLDAFIGNVTAAMVNADPILESVYNSVLSNPDPDNAAESIQAAIDGGLVIAANNFAADNNNINNLRLAALRTGSGVTGMAAGDELAGMKVWTQAFGKTAEQDRRQNIGGFDLDSYGVAFGADKELDALTIGLAFSYGNSEVDSKNATTTNTDIDSYQLSLYGDYDIGNAIYISGSVYYAYHDIETTRHNVGGVAGLNASGDFSANQFGARMEVGRDYKRGATLITPKVLTNISHYDADSYTETGAGGASLNVDSDAVDVVELGVGVDAKWSLPQNNGAVLEPTLSAEYRHDFIGDEVETNSSFTGTGASFQTKGFDPAQDTVNLGASVTYFSADNWELSAHYDYGFKSDYAAHSGFVKVAYKF